MRRQDAARALSRGGLHWVVGRVGSEALNQKSATTGLPVHHAVMHGTVRYSVIGCGDDVCRRTTAIAIVARLQLQHVVAVRPRAAEAHHWLGIRYQTGDGVPQDLAKAVRHFEISAAAGRSVYSMVAM